MTFASAAEQRLKSGDPIGALERLQEDVRARPADAKLRIFLFQLLCVLGRWERALNQLTVASTLDSLALPMAQMYGDAVRCEGIRTNVFAGKTAPMVLGEPDQWLAYLIESLLLTGRGEPDRAEEFRLKAFEQAPASAGMVDGRAFEWVADADSRLGPVLEAIINGRYYWVPFARLTRIDLDPPEDLRDIVWIPAHLQFDNGGESVALIPTRYAGSESAADGAIALARKTVWEEVAAETYHGLGQRVITTDQGDTPILDIRAIRLAPPPAAVVDGSSQDHG
jgi:type VI secretion system protein ImpE